tara:strand:+ start:664 stop:1008 length:345 start_codon:yes stop_codon:yes gene_type:complete
MKYDWSDDAIKHAKECNPEESCGVLININNKIKYIPCKNVANEIKDVAFIIDPLDYADAEDQGDVVGIVHSHPQDILKFSDADKYSCKSIDLPFYLVSPYSDKIELLLPQNINA